MFTWHIKEKKDSAMQCSLGKERHKWGPYATWLGNEGHIAVFVCPFHDKAGICGVIMECPWWLEVSGNCCLNSAVSLF